MDAEDIEQLQDVAEIHEKTDSTAERMRILCQLAESLDGDEIASVKREAEDAYGYPSLAKMSRGRAEMILERVEAVEEFRDNLEHASGYEP